ncbi:MAG: polysaccharide biosynthesis protein [Bryobacterales bacterium]|nr:polysaccharide biosynthesis protein [Bryobacterales bacterium]
MTFRLLHRHWVSLLRALHVVLIAASLTSAFLLRFDFGIPGNEAAHLFAGLAIALLCKSCVFYFARFDHGGWRYAGVTDLFRIIIANAIASALFAGLTYIVVGAGFPRSIYVIDLQNSILLTAGVRFIARLFAASRSKASPEPGARNVIIYGAGRAGVTILRELRDNHSLGYRALGFLDDDPAIRGTDIDGTQVLGRGRDASVIVEGFRRRGRNVDEIIIAMPSAAGRRKQEALANCRAAHVPCKTVPSIGELISGRVLTKQLREVSVLDLLGREPVKLDETQIRAAVDGRVVLVTGAAGSIGSELCRQLSHFDLKQLIAFEQNESELYRLQLELKDRFPQLDVLPCIGDIRDTLRVEEVIGDHHVDSIFHAAAYKHVPLMESHLLEALRNNVIGTYNLAALARASRVGSFLMISSDKAVHPTSIMGATKRVAELIVSSMQDATLGSTRFVCVRFGNVLGSNGSVIPLFKQQIMAGGPVTVTHPEMKRYFMTIPEAVQLVLQASTMGHGSEIFVLDMGEPVHIVDLARNMIRLSGRDESEIEIRFTGLRPGEKLFEELVLDSEDIAPTYHEKIKVLRSQRPRGAEIEAWIRELKKQLHGRDEVTAIQLLKQLVPEYNPDGHWREVLTKNAPHPHIVKGELHDSQRVSSFGAGRWAGTGD